MVEGGKCNLICCQHSFESSFILFIINFFIQKIIHPWHVAKYSSMLPNILSYVSNNILLMSTRYSWKDSLGLICSCSCIHHSCLHIHKIPSLVQIMGSIEDERTFSTLTFMKTKLWDKLCDHLDIVVRMFAIALLHC
jgi:hypothetical protein